MKRIRNLIIPFLFCISFNINAEQHDIFDEIHVSVNGLVCDFCAQSIVKMLNKEESVKAVDVNMDESMIKIDLKDGYDIDDKKITKLITDAGYNVEKIHRVE